MLVSKHNGSEKCGQFTSTFHDEPEPSSLRNMSIHEGSRINLAIRGFADGQCSGNEFPAPLEWVRETE